MKKSENHIDNNISVDWLYDQLDELQHRFDMKDCDTKYYISESKAIFKKAQDMYKVEMGKTWDAALDASQNRSWNIMRAYGDFDDYYDKLSE